jgi:hypothetical protein
MGQRLLGTEATNWEIFEIFIVLLFEELTISIGIFEDFINIPVACPILISPFTAYIYNVHLHAPVGRVCVLNCKSSLDRSGPSLLCECSPYKWTMRH